MLFPRIAVKHIRNKSSLSIFWQMNKAFATQKSLEKELSIPVPWGHIAGKEWNSTGEIPVLAIHGWLDNASSFDSLIPHLNSNLRIYAIDLPGHGRSSHYGPGATYGYNEALSAILYAVDFLNLDKFVLIGHSLGGELGFFISSLYPENTLKFVGIDLMKPVSHPTEFLLKQSRKYLDNYRKFENISDKKAPSYTEDEAAEKLVKGYVGSISKDSAKILLKRQLVPSSSGKGFMFSFDQRLRLDYFYMPLSNEQLRSFAKNIVCDFLFIKAIPGEYYEPIEEYRKMDELLRKENPNYHYIEVEGTHHLHLERPKVVGSIIDNFLKSLY